ncbi:MAG: PilZ domain-containing protein [Candidatus Omnitrophica bacterium]|nr:PilZ domain-containing protein [Candidatus Omnitrophota bacterium]
MKGWELGIGLLEENILQKTFCKDLQASLGLNRRETTRLSVSIPVRYRTKGLHHDWKPSASVDLSRKGIRISMPAGLPVGTRLELKFKLPENGSSPLEMEGTVVWEGQTLENSSLREYGVAFVEPKADSRKRRLTYFLADRFCQFALFQTKDLICQPAQNLEELKDAYRLVYKEYIARGYCAPSMAGMHYNFHCALPEACTFVLRMRTNGQMIGTVSLFGDSPCGLPMESAFPDLVAAYRQPGRRLAEVGLLALDHDAVKRRSFSLTDFGKLSSLFRLFKEMFDYARFTLKATDLIIGVHPKHEILYRYLTFETIGPARDYAKACGNPALPMRMDILRTVETTSAGHGKGLYFLRKPQQIPEKGFHFDAAAVRHMLMAVRPLWGQMTLLERAYFLNHHPDLITEPSPQETEHFTRTHAVPGTGGAG